MNEKKRPAKRVSQETKGTPKRAPKKVKREGKSIRWMMIALLIAVAFLGWAVAAASYASDSEEFNRPDMPVRGRASAGIALFVVGLIRVLWNAIVQIPNVHRVAWHTVTEHPAIPVITALVAAGICGFGWWMAKLERQFAKEDERFRRLSSND
jgi:cytochrome b561